MSGMPLESEYFISTTITPHPQCVTVDTIHEDADDLSDIIYHNSPCNITARDTEVLRELSRVLSAKQILEVGSAEERRHEWHRVSAAINNPDFGEYDESSVESFKWAERLKKTIDKAYANYDVGAEDDPDFATNMMLNPMVRPNVTRSRLHKRGWQGIDSMGQEWMSIQADFFNIRASSIYSDYAPDSLTKTSFITLDDWYITQEDVSPIEIVGHVGMTLRPGVNEVGLLAIRRPGGPMFSTAMGVWFHGRLIIIEMHLSEFRVHITRPIVLVLFNDTTGSLDGVVLPRVTTFFAEVVTGRNLQVETMTLKGHEYDVCCRLSEYMFVTPTVTVQGCAEAFGGVEIEVTGKNFRLNGLAYSDVHIGMKLSPSLRNMISEMFTKLSFLLGGRRWDVLGFFMRQFGQCDKMDISYSYINFGFRNISVKILVGNEGVTEVFNEITRGTMCHTLTDVLNARLPT